MLNLVEHEKSFITSGPDMTHSYDAFLEILVICLN